MVDKIKVMIMNINFRDINTMIKQAEKVIKEFEKSDLPKNIEDIMSSLTPERLKQISEAQRYVDSMNIDFEELNQVINNVKNSPLLNQTEELLQIKKFLNRNHIIETYAPLIKDISFNSKQENQNEAKNKTVLVLDSISKDIENTLTEEDIEQISSTEEMKNMIDLVKKNNPDLSPRQIINLAVILYWVVCIFYPDLDKKIAMLITAIFGKLGIFLVDRWKSLSALADLIFNFSEENKNNK